MEYRKEGNFYFLRLDVGDEIVSSLHHLAETENILAGSVFGIGATNDVTVGLFDTQKKQYYSNTYLGDMEITSLTGNISRQNGQPYLHLHITIADETNQVIGGHLNRGVISITGEITVLSATLATNREFSEEKGINELTFPISD